MIRAATTSAIPATLEEWAQVRDEYLAYLGTISDDTAWERAGRHPQYPPFSLNDQLFLICWHDMIHRSRSRAF